MNNILEVKDLKTGFKTDRGYFRVVDGVSFHVAEGETVGIVGESGCGKSVTSLSLMRLVAHPGQIEPTSEIYLNGKDLTQLSEREMRRLRGNQISMIFQEPMTSLNPVYTIGRQLTEAIKIHQRMNKSQSKARAIELLQQVGIPRANELVTNYPHQLSGGMRQRVMIAIAIACNPKVLIADEPTTALDVTIQAQILELMKDLQRKLGMAILMITHDLGVVAETCDRVMVMYAGKVVEEGPVREIFNNPSHPYTKGLLASVPSLDANVHRLPSIPGSVPMISEMPSGCRFAPRCQEAISICTLQEPELLELNDHHKCRCFVAQEGGVLV